MRSEPLLEYRRRRRRAAPSQLFRHSDRGGNENLFLIDGTNFTCPCAGVSRAEPSVDVIQEVQVQSVGISAEYGNIQGTVFNVVTRQGSNRFAYDAAYYAQTDGLTAQPVVLPVAGNQSQSGYRRAVS
jgi:hypothetical protein